jgi:hypothetical protein
LRLCLDLNIWVAALLADRKGRVNTGSQYLVEIVRNGSSPIGAVNLIISLGMLDELTSVIVEHLGLNIETADAYVCAIEEYAKLGAQLTLGGTGGNWVERYRRRSCIGDSNCWQGKFLSDS